MKTTMYQRLYATHQSLLVSDGDGSTQLVGELFQQAHGTYSMSTHVAATASGVRILAKDDLLDDSAVVIQSLDDRLTV
jgi:hypothetical protein